ncbi:unnamed protein product [Rotaria sp. Silwood2]|nr:unnamed protein product [Rotaria sp. Silwood2]
MSEHFVQKLFDHTLFQDNTIHGCGLLARSLIQAQLVSPFYTLVSVINRKVPEIGELILQRLIITFRHTYQRNDKTNSLSAIKFLSHLIDQNVLHDRILLQILILLLENKTNNSVQLAIKLINECEQQLSQPNPRELDLIFTTLRNLLHEASLAKHTQYIIEVLFAE